MKLLEQGEDVEIIELRNKIPEPSQTLARFIQIHKHTRKQTHVYDAMSLIPFLDIGEYVITFEKVTIVRANGDSYFAWMCIEDNKLYF